MPKSLLTTTFLVPNLPISCGTRVLALGGFPGIIPLGPLPAGTARGLCDTIAADPELLARLFEQFQNGFFSRPADAARFTPRFAKQFAGPKSSLAPLRSLIANLFPAVQVNGQRLAELRKMQTPLHLIWGARDPDLTLAIPRELHATAPRCTLTVLARARHNLQIDEPARVAALLNAKTR